MNPVPPADNSSSDASAKSSSTNQEGSFIPQPISSVSPLTNTNADTTRKPDWKEVLEFVQQQGKLDRENFFHQLKITYGFIAVAGVIVAFLIGKTFNDIQRNAREQTDEVIKEMKASVRKQVAEQFQEENIRKLVSAAAQAVSSAELNAVLQREVSKQVIDQVTKQTPFIRTTIKDQSRLIVDQALRPRLLSAEERKLVEDVLRKRNVPAKVSFEMLSGYGQGAVPLATQLADILKTCGYEVSGSTKVPMTMSPGKDYTGIGIFVRNENEKSKAKPIVEALARVNVYAQIEIEDTAIFAITRIPAAADLKILFGARF